MISRNFNIALAALVGQQIVFSQPSYRNANANPSSLVQPLYTPLVLGSIKPLGWFNDQLQLEADGLSGNMFDFYRFVNDSRWIGGHTEYSALDEASPYWFNAIVPLAFGLGDERLIGQVRYYLDYVLDHQQEDGWLGFEKTRATRGVWARCLLFLGLMQYADADPTQTDRIVTAMHRYVNLAHSMLSNNYTGLLVHGNDTFDTAGFGVGRTHEYHIPLQWLLENHPRNNSKTLLEMMDFMIDGGVQWGADWRTFWTKESYPKVLDDNYNMSWVFIHGVNMAQGLRYPLSLYRNTHDEALKQTSRTALDLLAKYHTSTAGSIIADEYISDLNPSRGSELCIAAEIMFSTAYMYQFLGDNDIADWTEQTAFNAFPAAVSADWWSHQYVQQENQPWSRNLSTAAAWYDVNSYANVFGLEPNYPCCTVNHPQAYPKFLANSFVKTADGGVAHVFLVPGSAATTLGEDNSNSVFITANTTYPFGNTIAYSITASSPFDFSVRIPNWADANSTINSTTRIQPDSRGMHKFHIPAGKSSTSVQLSTSPRVVPRANNTAAIYYGALLYALAIEHDSVSTPPISYRSQEVLPSNTTDPLSRTRDYKLTPRSSSKWNIAIDASQISVVGPAHASKGPLTSPIWDLGAPPVELRVKAVEIEWPVENDTPANPGTFAVVKVGEPFEARFVPYGSAKLHMAVLPVVEL